MLLSVLLLVSTTALLAVLRASPLTSLPQHCDLYLRQLTASGTMPLLTDNIADSERPCPQSARYCVDTPLPACHA